MSSQVINGLDANNNLLVTQQFSNVTSDSDGLAILTFSLLNDNTTYSIYISAECVLPFQPRLRLDDSAILSAQVTTPLNLNLMKNSDKAVT